jgi:hypothetical protein
MLLGAICGLGLFSRTLKVQAQTSRRRGVVRLILAAWSGGMLAYLAYGFLGEGIGQWVRWPNWVVAGLAGLVGAMVSVAIFGVGLRKR